MSQPRTDWTAEMLDELPDDGNRYEIIDGELFVTPAPLNVHQFAIAELHLLLAQYVKSVGLDLLFAPSAVRFSMRREVQPDLLVMPKLDGKHAKKFQDVGRLILAVEILSPSTARTDRVRKRALYQDERVPEYWIVDADARVIERWQLENDRAEVISDTLIWQPDALHTPLSIDVPSYFHSVLDE